MPVGLVNPATQPQAPAGVPTSPIAGMLDQMVGVLGKRYPTPEEQAQMDYLRSKTAETQQQMGAAGTLQDIINRTYNAQPTTSTSTAEAPRPDAGFVGPEPGVTTTTTTPAPSVDQLTRQNLPALMGAVAAAGKYSDIGSVARAYVANAPGISTTKGADGAPSPVDMAMLGAGDSYNSTIGGMREHESLDTARELAKIKATAQYGMTGSIKDHNFKVQEIMRNQGVDEPTAEGIVDGVLKVEVDPQTQNAYLVNIAKGTSSLLRSPAQGATGTRPPAQNAPSAGPLTQPTGVDGPDWLTEVSNAQSGGTHSPQGGPVTLSTDAPASAPAPAPAAIPTLSGPSDLKVNFNNALGGPATIARLEGMVAAATGSHDPAAAAAAQQSNQLKDLQSRISAVLGLRPGLRNDASAQALITSQLPSSGLDIMEPKSWLANASKDPQAAFGVVRDKMNEIMQDRTLDAQMLADPDLSREDRQAAKERINMADKLMADYLPPDKLAQYQAATGSKLGPAASPSAAAPAASTLPAPVEPKTNLQKGIEATTMPAYTPIPQPGKPPITDADIIHTAKTHGLTVQQVIDKLKASGQVK